jgi:uncharacterized membrane protein YdbT with pleckstrin-like domain
VYKAFSPTVDKPQLPRRVGDYILPNEKVVVLVRHHVAYVGRALFIAPLSLLIAVILSIILPGVAAGVVWLLWLIPAIYCIWNYLDWRLTYFCVTIKRVLLIRGVFNISVAMLPIGKVTDVALERPWLGRILGYGTFDVESAGPEQRLRNIEYMPWPLQLYLEIQGLQLPDVAGDEADEF